MAASGPKSPTPSPRVMRPRAERVVSGGRRRRRDTAGPGAAALATKVEIDERWDEYEDRDILGHHADVPAGLEQRPGDAPLSSREFQEILNRALVAWITAGAEGPSRETWPQFHARVTGALTDLAGRLGKGQTALVISSGG